MNKQIHKPPIYVVMEWMALKVYLFVCDLGLEVNEFYRG